MHGARELLYAVTLSLCVLAAGCAGGGGEAPAAGDRVEAPRPAASAEELAREILIVDTHVDLPYRLIEQVEAGRQMDDIGQETEGNFDIPKARRGGLDAPFMSIYVPASYQESGGAREYADRLIDLVEGLVAAHPEDLAPASSPAELRRVVAAGKIALPLGMENGAPVEDDLENLRHFHRRGIRYITLTHSKNNQISDSSFDQERKWNGLSPFGREVVAEMNRLGIMIDVSHVSDDAFDQVLELTRAPVIASHSSARHFTPGFERNLDDERIRRLADNGGVIQINFGSIFLREDAQKQGMAYWQERGRYLAENGIPPGDPLIEQWDQAYWSERDKIFADLADVVAHIDHVVQLVGVDHVGLGSDFDGVGDSLPTGLKDVSEYPNLIRALLEKGYSREDVEKIAGGNLLRVWQEVERVAAAGG